MMAHPDNFCLARFDQHMAVMPASKADEIHECWEKRQRIEELMAASDRQYAEWEREWREVTDELRQLGAA